MQSVAVVTGSTVPHPDLDETSLIEALAALGFDAKSVAWDDDSIDWSLFAAAVVRSTWNYELQRSQFVAWMHSVEKATTLLNPAQILEQNTDKSYLADLARAGVNTIATVFTRPGDGWNAPTNTEEYVVKPSVAGGARNCGRFSTASAEKAAALVDAIHATRRTVMTQPYVTTIDTDGERVMIFIDGILSHCVLRGPILARDGAYTDTTIGWKTVARFDPSDQDVKLAQRALEVLGADDLTYARVDVVTDDDGNSCVLEVELTEPCLFLEHSEYSVDRLAQAIASRIAH